MKNPRLAIDAARFAFPREACGITMDGVAVELTNASKRPHMTFNVTPEELKDAIRTLDGAWDGVWHSHPDDATEPSEDDVNWHPPGKALYVVAGGRVWEYNDQGEFVRVIDE